MTFDQNSTPMDLRQLDVGGVVMHEQPGIVAATASTAAATIGTGPVGRNPEAFANHEESAPVIYPGTVLDADFASLGFGNPVPPCASWAPLVPVQVGNANVSAVGFAYCPSAGNRVVGNAVHHDRNNVMCGVAGCADFGNRVNTNGGNQFARKGSDYNLGMGTRGRGSGFDHGSEDGGKKVKFLCSSRGKILPRPSDGILRYVGGQTRIVSVKRNVSFNDLLSKMTDSYGQQPVVIKYQLPDEDLDALITVSCPDDLENMMDEYEKLVEISSDGSAKLRVFLFGASQLDSSGIVEYGDLHDGGQRYIEAVNGIMDGVGGGITRKESISRSTSTQNFDFSCTEAVDVSGSGQANVISPPSSDMISLREISTTAHDSTSKLPSVNPEPPVHVDASAVSLAIPVGSPGSPQTLSSQPEVEFEIPIPDTVPKQQMEYDFQQVGMGITSHASVTQPSVDPLQEITNHADYVHVPSQMNLNAQLPRTVGSIPIQHHFHVNNAGVSPCQFVPAQTMIPSLSHIPTRPAAIQPSARHQYHYDENAFGTRIVQLPVDPIYNAYYVQPPPAAVGGGYAWFQVPQPDHVFSDRFAHQQVNCSEKIDIQRLEDCHLCQRALLHAHSDPMMQERKRECVANTFLDSTSVHQSLARPKNKVTVALGEEVADGDGDAPSIAGKEHQIEAPKSEAFGVSQNLEPLHQNQRRASLKHDAFDQSKISAPTSMICLSGELPSSYGIVMGGIPQSQFEGSIHQQYMPNQNHVTKEIKHVISYAPHTVGVSEQLVHAMADSCTSYDHLLPVDGKLQKVLIFPPETSVNRELNEQAVYESKKEEILDHRTQKILGREVLLDNTLSNRQVVLDPNHIKHTEFLPASSGVSCVHDSRVMESYQVPQLPVPSNPAPYPQSETGNQLLYPADVSYAVSALAGVEPVEGKIDDSRMRVKIPSRDVEALSSTGNTPSSLSATTRVGDVQGSSNSLFSHQDPWSWSNDNHFLQPKPTNFATKAKDLVKEVLLEDEIDETLDNSQKDFISEHIQPSKESTEVLAQQELQTVAEVVAASVFPSVSTNELNQDTVILNKDVEIQQKAKFEETKNKLPVAQGIGSLQIIRNTDLEELQELGSGTFGTVYHGKWRGTDVAIKRINNDRCFSGKASEQERMIDDFWSEAIKLADLHHPNVVAFYGIVLDGPGGTVATVTEYMVNGSLRNALQKNERSLDKRKILLIAMDVAFGMEYLHGKNIVHFDLKSDNLLVNLRDPHRPICKVGDLGLSKVKCRTLVSGGVRGTLPWMAPELLNGSSSLVSEKVDVFSFGIVMWELLTGEEPYADLHYGAIIGGILNNTLRPPVPESCDPEWRSMMERCWASEPSDRPNFTEIANELQVMAGKNPPNGQNSVQQESSSSL